MAFAVYLARARTGRGTADFARRARTPRLARIWLMETRLTHLLAFYRSEHVNQN
jgi:hypothetical protein